MDFFVSRVCILFALGEALYDLSLTLESDLLLFEVGNGSLGLSLVCETDSLDLCIVF